MARNTNIRLSKNDKQEYTRLVRNAKAKIRRTAEKFGIDLSKEIHIPKLEELGTRKAFNEFKKQTKRLTNRSNQNFQFRKNEFGVVASVKEINEVKQNTKRAQNIAKQLAKEAENKPFISGGKEQGTVGQRMKQMRKPSAAGIVIPPDFDFNKIPDRKRFEQKSENMAERAGKGFFDQRTEQMKKNYMKLLEKSFNSDADTLIDMLNRISAKDFYEMYLMFDEFDFDYPYIIDNDSAPNFLGRLEGYVERFEAGKINMDLSGF